MTTSLFQPPEIASIRNGLAAIQLSTKLQHKLDHKTKPLGALGQLEALAIQLGLIQQSEMVSLKQPQIVVFAGDHGIVDEGVSAYPQAVTTQMVANMLGKIENGVEKKGGAAINVLAHQHNFNLTVVDAGVASILPEHPRLLQLKIAPSTRNSVLAPAMSDLQAVAALQAGMDVVRQLAGNVVAFGEMGIGNTSSAALILSLFTPIPVADCAGRGTGLTDEQMKKKVYALTRAHRRHHSAKKPFDILCAVGGFEIAMMAGAMLQAASERRIILVDGFIAGAAALVAVGMAPAAKDYMVFTHVGAEFGHQAMLKALAALPLLDLGLRLGEGTGALLAWPLVVSSARLLNEMASFESAGVSQKV
ncbi:nicotinate-nucleotide--dimethylbenzimidazole phosphoribosyltransferase [Variovorax sp. PCZ-1]|uniref:nicotinate-nucleotide--dimethylbenzimidazole phosphoribosyltransferase n=1 Tax=Variovorax sp. PCZ-1 TaxID=2835533 RepID=UPI001BCFBEA3|nr:nicotinate-nucleotide--dimethylbenzimidazole phosphoribosyltransferase [Variovorax sp. PCZ-1]MBS7806172.1 nicotinate-nucleotide--dimethylbenzimidazole phosphoribosyltransferase [Variovorax sp. PCZ-1]